MNSNKTVQVNKRTAQDFPQSPGKAEEDEEDEKKK